MACFDKVARPDETLRHSGELHWIIYLPGALLILVSPVFMSTEKPSLTGLFILFGVISLSINWIRKHTTEIVVTEKRVLLKTGLLSRKTFEMNMNRVESVDVTQSIMGRIFDYGAVLVRGTGAGAEPFKKIAAPLDLRNSISVH